MASYLDFYPHEPQREDHEQEQEEVEEEDEAPSLCDLPLNHHDVVAKKCNGFELDDTTSSRQSRRSSLSEAVDFFEFFNDASSDMCSAEDIVFCGRLFNDTDQSPPKGNMKDLSRPPVYRRRSESLSALQSGVTRSNSATTCGNPRRLMMRNSKSLDYRRLHRSSSSLVIPEVEIERNPSVRSVVQSEIVVKRSIKPRWFFLFFGIVRVPSEMDLGDIKNRQIRRNRSTTMFPSAGSSGKLSVNRSSGKVSWKILKALSCKDYNSVSVTTPFVTT